MNNVGRIKHTNFQSPSKIIRKLSIIRNIPGGMGKMLRKPVFSNSHKCSIKELHRRNCRGDRLSKDRLIQNQGRVSIMTHCTCVTVDSSAWSVNHCGNHSLRTSGFSVMSATSHKFHLKRTCRVSQHGYQEKSPWLQHHE